MAEKITYPFLPEDKCLTEQQLFDYIDGKLNATEMHLVEKHLLACEMCSDALEGFEKVKHREKVAAFSPANFSKSIIEEKITEQVKVIPLNPNRKNYAIAAGLVLIISITLFLKHSVSGDMESAKTAELTQKDSSISSPTSSMESSGTKQDSVSTNSVTRSEGTNANGGASFDKQNHSSLGYLDTVSNSNKESDPRKGLVMEDQVSPQTVSGDAIPDAPIQQFATNEKSADDNSQSELVDLAKAEQKKSEAENDRDAKESVAKNKVPAGDGSKSDQSVKVASGRANEKQSTHAAKDAPSSVASGTNAAPSTGGVVTQQTVLDEENTISTVADSTTVSPKFYPLKPSDKDLDQSYETGVKMLDSGQVNASLIFFDQVLTNPTHKNFEDAQWKKSLALIQLHRNAEAKILLQQIEKKGGKYKTQATEELKKL